MGLPFQTTTQGWENEMPKFEWEIGTSLTIVYLNRVVYTRRSTADDSRRHGAYCYVGLTEGDDILSYKKLCAWLLNCERDKKIGSLHIFLSRYLSQRQKKFPLCPS